MKPLTFTVRTLLALGILALMGVILGAFSQEFFRHEIPCPLCWLQRLGMIGVATGAAMHLQFGVRIKYYALSLLSAFCGGVVAARQIFLHICPGFPEFGYPVFGMGLYTWAFIVFCCATLGTIFLLFLYRPDQKERYPLNGFERLAFFVLIGVTVINIFVVFYQCGFGPCKDVPWPQKEQTSS